MSDSDNISHPPHYGGADDPYEAIKVIHAWNLGFALGNVLKYIRRYGHKGDSIEQLKKARFYLDDVIARREADRVAAPQWVKEKTRDELLAAAKNALQALRDYDTAHASPSSLMQEAAATNAAMQEQLAQQRIIKEV